MTEAFRRDDNMISTAIHLFIDAWPSGWMKTIMDFKRNPKPAYFAYRNALSPILVSLRTDRFAYFVGEKINIECWICNDTQLLDENAKVIYELYRENGEFVMRGEHPTRITPASVKYSCETDVVIDKVNKRERFTLKAIPLDENDKVVTYNDMEFDVFEDCTVPENKNVVFVQLSENGRFEIAGETVEVKDCGMLPVHFVSRKTGHPAVEMFKPKDFSYWYDKDSDMITPIAHRTFTADGFTAILTSGNTDSNNKWNKALVCAEKCYQGKWYIQDWMATVTFQNSKYLFVFQLRFQNTSLNTIFETVNESVKYYNKSRLH